MPGFADLQSCLGRAQGTGSGNPLQPHSVMSMRLVAVVVALIACVHAGLWALSWEQAAAPDVTGPLASVSYAPFADAEHPDRGHRPTAVRRQSWPRSHEPLGTPPTPQPCASIS